MDTDSFWPTSLGDNLLPYSPTWDSDEECLTDFAYSDICLNAFYLSGCKTSQKITNSEQFDEDSNCLQASISPKKFSGGDRCSKKIEHKENGALNKRCTERREFSVPEYNETLVNLMNAMFVDILTDNNRIILYYKLPESQEYAAYIDHIENLCSVKLTQASEDERLALFLNIYNMMWIHVTHLYGPPRNIWERRKLMNCNYYQIEHHNYALHSILDGILRSNHKGPGTLWKPFGKVDGRLKLILSTSEPFVHFALNTGTKSTPPIRAYNCQTVREELRKIACDVLESDDMLRIDEKKKILYIAKTFKWYAKDFGGNAETIIEWILMVMEGLESKKRNLEAILQDDLYEIEYIQHDWTFNGLMFENKFENKQP